MRRLAALALGAALLVACAGAPAQHPNTGASAPPNPGGSAAPGAAGGAANSLAAAGAATAAVPTAPVPEGRIYPAADDAPVQIKAAWCAVTGAQFPLWLAKESGVFARHRIEAEISMIQGSTPAIAALQRGDIDFLECSGGAIAPGLMAGAEALFIGNFYTGNFFRLMAVPEVESVADLRGRKVAIDRPGDYSNRLNEVLLERNGLTPNQDVTLVPIGSQSDRYNALKSGVVDATTVNPPLNLTAQREGYHEIYNLEDLGIAGISVSLYATPETVKSRARLVERFLAAMTETALYAKTHRPRTMQVMGDYLKLSDREALAGAYDTYATKIATRLAVPVDALQAVMDENLKVNPNAPIRDAAQIIDNRAAEAVANSGFVEVIEAEYGVAPSGR
ncbi:MAG TPA: ABC transporter substrate-binding protein [Chloroflexota bacterium]|nr:ABC transporter substrate-binding protein [Chloroflexota bacterium]